MSRTCPKCGSDNITYQTFQENRGGKTVTRKKTRITGRVDVEYEPEGHGCLWWIFIGWWWVFYEFIFRIIFGMILFIPRLIIGLFTGSGINAKITSTTKIRNKVIYRKMAQCQDCGRTWKC